MTAIDVVVMAAGKGTRMKSRLPKVLHRLAGRPLLQHVMDAVAALDARRVVVITGNGAAEVEAAVAGWAAGGRAASRRFLCGRSRNWAPGTPCSRPMPSLHDDGTTLILNGDVPLIEADTLRQLVAALRRRTACAAEHRVARPDRLRPHPARGCPGARHRRAQGRDRGPAPAA